jgi:hypothetical protein
MSAPTTRARVVVTMIATAWIAGAPAARAQSVEVTPFGGYRFGGDIFEAATGRALDVDGAPAVGVAVDVPLSDGFQIEGMFSHQQTNVQLPLTPVGAPARVRVAVDHWQGGGLQEFSGTRVRPFLTGTLGLTRYAAEGDNEIRFTLGAGGGVKLFPMSRLGIRLDGRAFATFLDAEGTGSVCPGTGPCRLIVHVNVAWQAEFTAGLVFRFH